MAIASLDDLFTDNLRDIYYAEKQILKALGQMSKKVQSEQLRDALDHHRQETEGQVDRLEQVFELLGERARAKKCPAIEGILNEAKEQMDEIEDENVCDAAIISNAQSVEHYEIARYGTLIAWAHRLGNTKAADLLEETLEEEKAADGLLTDLAESEINLEAMEAGQSEEGEDDEDEDRQSSRGRQQPSRNGGRQMRTQSRSRQANR